MRRSRLTGIAVALGIALGGLAAACSGTKEEGQTLADDVPKLATAGAEAGIDAASTATDASEGGALIDAATEASDGSDAEPDAPPVTGGGPGLRFDGLDDRIIVALGSGAVDETAFTSEVWFRSTEPTGMLTEVWATGGGADRSLYLRDGSVCFFVAPASELCTASTSLNDGAWHHVAGTLGAVLGQVLYVDGAAEASDPATTTSSFETKNSFRAGFGYVGPGGPLVSFAGDLAEVRVWTVERPGADIEADRSRAVAPSSAGLTIYWRLTGYGASTQALDSSANARNGKLTGFTAPPTPWGAGSPF